MNYHDINKEKKRQQISFRRFIKGESCPYFIREYVALNLFEIREYLESKMVDGMTWYNYGDYWVVDHIVPLRLFNVFDERELKIAWDYQNLMPLKKKDNLHKEGDLRFSIIILNKMQDTYTVQKLKEKIYPELKKMELYHA